MKKKLTAEQSAQIRHHAEIMQDIYGEMALRGESLHPGQIQVAKDILVDGKRVVQSQWGRKGGKTFTSCFIAWTFALLNPGAQAWIICPQRKQGKDIYWVSGRIQNFGPQKYVEQQKESEITVQFKNRSIIKIEGCENYPALRGVNPDLVIYDEFQDHSKEFHVEVMAPNLIAKKAALLVIGTPPKRDCYYVEFRKQLLDEIKARDDTRAYYEFPSEINPTLDKKELEKIRTRLYKAGDEKIWLREYMAQLIWGGEGAVFSPWNRDKHVKSHRTLISAIENDISKLRWFTIFDPGSMTCFGELFCAYNHYTSQIFILDEIYETNSHNTDALSMFKRAIVKEKELYPNRPPRTFRRIYDEAALWFEVNTAKVLRHDPEFHMSPCTKNKIKGQSSKESDCSLIKQIMGADNVFFVSDRCQKLIWEIENYVVDDSGRYPQDHDHLIDCLIYFLKACNYKFIDDVPEISDLNDNWAIKKRTSVTQLKNASEWSDNVLEESLYDSSFDGFWQ